MLESFITFLKKNSKFYLIYGNILAILILLYIFISPPLIRNLPLDQQASTMNQIGYSISYSIVLLVYPYFGLSKKEISNPKKLMLIIFFIFIGLTIWLDSFGIFMGYNNFMWDYNYGHDYFYGILSQYTKVYYPLGSSIYFVFCYITNPWGSTLLYRLMSDCWGLGIYYMVYKISTIEELGIDRKKLGNIFIYITFSGIQMLFFLLTQKGDYFEIFLSLIGIYFTIKKRWFWSAFIFIFCGFFKLYAFLWIGGILLLFLKQKKWSDFKKYLVSTVIAGSIFIILSYLIEGDKFFQNLFSFRWQFSTEIANAYNLNFGYYLQFFGISYLNVVPYVLIFGIFILYALKFVKKIDLNFFINVVLIILIFYPAVNFQYLIWIIPIIGLNLMNHIDQYRKSTAVFELIHVNADLHAFSWLMIFGLNDALYLISTDPLELFVVLFIRFILLFPMVIGLCYYFILNNLQKEKSLIHNPNTFIEV